MAKLSDEQIEFTRHLGWLIMYAYSLNYGLTVGDAYRSPEEQDRLFKAGKSKIRVGGNHGKRLAKDFNVFIKVDGKWTLTWDWEVYKKMGDYWESLDPKNRWGGDWNNNDKIDKGEFTDAPHFERNL